MKKILSNRRDFLRNVVAITSVSPFIAGEKLFAAERVPTEKSASKFAVALPDRVTHIDLKESLKLAGANLMAILEPDRNYLPIWAVLPVKDGTVSIVRGWEGHNLG
jgi:hypothetical protein